jgi:membrane protease subunit (stomatin/prohibitin family)
MGFNSIEIVILLFLFILVAGFVGVIIAVRMGRKPKPAQESEELQDYEHDYLARQGIESTRRKPAETKESESNFCDNCGKSLRPTAKFCSGCGSPRS